jgi:hypothetical protein
MLINRRDFLKLTAAGLALLLLNQGNTGMIPKLDL